MGWRLWEHLSRCRTWSGGSGTRSTLTGASPTAHLGGHPEGGRTREEGYPARARTPRGLAWKLGELEGHRPLQRPLPPTVPTSLPVVKICRVLLVEPESVFADPRPFTEQSEGWRAVSADLTGADGAGVCPSHREHLPHFPSAGCSPASLDLTRPQDITCLPTGPTSCPLPTSLPSVCEHPLGPPISAPASFSREVLLTLCPLGASFSLLSTADKVMNVWLVLCPLDAGPCAQAAVHTVGAH